MGRRVRRGDGPGSRTIRCRRASTRPGGASPTARLAASIENIGHRRHARHRRAVVEALARREGVVVYLGCRDLAAGQAVAPHDGVVPVLLDVTDPASIKTTVETVRAAGGLDAVVNNAGVMDEENVERTLSVNLDGVAAVTAAFAPLLGAGGRVINVSSGAGLRAAAALAPADREALEADTVADRARPRPAAAAASPVYGISKAAVNAYTKLAARTYPALRVNALAGLVGPRSRPSATTPSASPRPRRSAHGREALFDDALSQATGALHAACRKPLRTRSPARPCKTAVLVHRPLLLASRGPVVVSSSPPVVAADNFVASFSSPLLTASSSWRFCSRAAVEFSAANSSGVRRLLRSPSPKPGQAD